MKSVRHDVHEPPAQLDGFHEECGVFGVYGSDEASVLTALGLHALQHRGQEAAGIVTFDGTAFHAHRAVQDIFEVAIPVLRREQSVVVPRAYVVRQFASESLFPCSKA